LIAGFSASLLIIVEIVVSMKRPDAAASIGENGISKDASYPVLHHPQIILAE
jgi:hypothetical protein